MDTGTKTPFWHDLKKRGCVFVFCSFVLPVFLLGGLSVPDARGQTANRGAAAQRASTKPNTKAPAQQKKPPAKPAAKPAAKSAPKPAAKPAPKPAARPAAKPAAKPAARPAASRARNTAKPADSATQKKAAETERGEVREQLTRLKREIGKTETERSKVADTLSKAEEAIASTNRSINELEKNRTSTETRLSRLVSEKSKLEATVYSQQNQLGRLLQEQYVFGNEGAMKFLLSGDNPNRIHRELQFMTYISAAQVNLTRSLKTNLTAVEEKRKEAATIKDELDLIVRQMQGQKQKLEKEKADREVILAQLSTRLERQQKQAERLEQDEKRLSDLVATLNRRIETQRRQAQEKREQASRQAQKKGDTPQTVEAVAGAEAARSSFARMRGSMRLPVRGTITARYGSKRADGPSWKGIFIQTEPGAEIRSVANGEVIFADWLRGFGNLIILDHGSQYMTIYANAQALRRKVGDNVKGGDVIASAGNSSDNAQTGLYFEMRHNGRAFNPMDWVVTR